MLCDSNYTHMTLWNGQNCGGNKKISGCQGFELVVGGEVNRLEHRGFQGNETSLCVAIMVDTQHLEFKLNRTYTAKSEH